jgi:hypothetical protein
MHSDDGRSSEWFEQHTYDRRYMVLRTEHHQPGTPWVIKAMADDIAFTSLYTEYEEFTREEMLADPELADALQRWESEIDPVHRMERALEDAETGARGRRKRTANQGAHG